MSDISDYAAMVTSHNLLIGVPAIATRFSDAQTVEITLADPVFDPQRSD
jgi:hypothetical protein